MDTGSSRDLVYAGYALSDTRIVPPRFGALVLSIALASPLRAPHLEIDSL